MNAQELYENLKKALHYFGLSFHEMDQVEVKLAVGSGGKPYLTLHHDKVTIHLSDLE